MLVFVACWPLLAWLAGQLIPAIGAGDFQTVLRVIGLALAEAHDAISRSIRETNSLNLDRRLTMLQAFEQIDKARRA